MNKPFCSAFVAAVALAFSPTNALAMFPCPGGGAAGSPEMCPGMTNTSPATTNSGSTSGSDSSSGGSFNAEYNSPNSGASGGSNSVGQMNLGNYNANLNSNAFQDRRHREAALQAAEWYMDCKSHWPLPGTCETQLNNLYKAAGKDQGKANRLAKKACSPVASIKDPVVGQREVQVEQDAYLFLSCRANWNGDPKRCLSSLAPLGHDVAVLHNYYNSCQSRATGATTGGGANCTELYQSWQIARNVCLPLAQLQGNKKMIDICQEVTCSDPSQNATAIYNGKNIALKGVCNVTIEGLADATLIGQVQHFETADPGKDCLDGEAINYWTAPKEFPGVYVVHNGWMGPQCSYGTWTFPLKGQ